jgi:hypothetical protein
MSFVDKQVVHMKNCTYLFKCFDCLTEKYLLLHNEIWIFKVEDEVGAMIMKLHLDENILKRVCLNNFQQ